ncbi:MAG: hypothetical protein WD250_06780 [Egibacteraceae bacterium]
MTLVHEVGHAAFDMPDTRINNDVDRYDLGAGTSNLADASLFRSSAWQAMRLGWADPTVVTHSGYYEVPASPLGDPFVLYDPARGTDEHFVVENRVGGSDHYDQGLLDIGLVVWRVDERNYHPVGAQGAYLSLTRPDDGSATFSPGVEPGDPQRTLDGATWLDDSDADIAIRAISPVGDVMRVYFDVPGAGILVDPITHASNGTAVDLAPGDYAIRAATERFGRHTAGVDSADYRVLTAAQRVQQLRDHVTDADLRPGIERSLTAKLESTLERLEAGDSASACHPLQAFANEVQALQGRQVSEARAAAWLHETRSIRAQLSCST